MAKAKSKQNRYLQDKNGDLFLDCKQLSDRERMRKVNESDLKDQDFETVTDTKAREKAEAKAAAKADSEAQEKAQAEAQAKAKAAAAAAAKNKGDNKKDEATEGWD